MNTKSQKELAARMLKCGVSRVRVKQDKAVEEALTRNDIAELIQKGTIKKVQKKGTTRARAKKILSQKKRGRRNDRGSRKGTMNARSPEKNRWMKTIRTLRKTLKSLYGSGRISQAIYRQMYPRTKGGFFRNKSHLLLYLKEHEMLKPEQKAARPKARTVKK